MADFDFGGGAMAQAEVMLDPSLPYEQLARDLTALGIATPAEDLLGFSVDDDVSSARSALAGPQFDYAPVFSDGRLVGRVAREMLEGGGGSTVGDVFEPLTSRFLVSADSPIAKVMRWLQTERCLLLLDGQDFVGLVSPADLNRHPVRVYFYMLLADFEIRLAALIRRLHPDRTSLSGFLSEGRREALERRYRDAIRRDVDVDLVGLFDLKDLCRVAGRSRKVRDALGFPSATKWDENIGSLINFRNLVMHPTRNLLGDVADLDRLVEMDRRLRSLLARLPFG